VGRGAATRVPRAAVYVPIAAGVQAPDPTTVSLPGGVTSNPDPSHGLVTWTKVRASMSELPFIGFAAARSFWMSARFVFEAASPYRVEVR
jgi:hypothetical protein